MRKCLLLVLAIFVNLITNAQTFYVSSTEGSNMYDGLSDKTPKHDLAGIPKEGVTILLKCGDVFWGGISGYKNCTIASYGEGDRPVICGFKVLVNPNAWIEIGNGRWYLELDNTDNFRGNVEKKQDASYNNIGFIYDCKQDKIYGRNLKDLDSLKREMDFFTSNSFTLQDVKDHPFDKVYVTSEKNPSAYGNLCFPMYQSGVSDMTNCVIKGIAVAGFSRTGMVRLNGCLVEDCQIDLIGGAILLGYTKRARYGNGVELWYNRCDNVIRDCLISRTYDCATTIQANGDIKSNPQNNHIVNNRIYKCRQAFEHFMNPSDEKLVLYDDCEFSGNICYMMGENEFDSPEMRDCNILSYENKAKPIIIKKNVFFGGNHLDGSGIDDGMTDNTIYLYQGQYLYTRHWYKTPNTIIASDIQTIEQYRSITHDNSNIVVLKRKSIKAWWIDRRIRRKVGWKPVELHLERILD